MRTARWWALWALLVTTWLLAPQVSRAQQWRDDAAGEVLLAQQTGGSFGGSRWGSGSSGSSGSSRPSSGSSWGGGGSSRPSYGGSYGSRPSYGSSGSSYGGSYGSGSYSGGGGGGGLGIGGFCILAFIILVVVIIALVGKRNNTNSVQFYPPPPMGGAGGYGAPPGAFTPETFSLGALAIAFDGRARRQVQSALDGIAAQVNFNAPDGLDQAAQLVSQTLTQYLDAAFMTHHAVSQPMPMQATQQQFQQAVDTERGRFVVETVRADTGGVRKINAPSSTGRAEEGDGFVVVTLLVARRGDLNAFRPITGRADLAHDLQVLLAQAGPQKAMQAMEVVWQPSDPNDVMSSAEMAVVFPTLKPIAPDARVGRQACAYCKSMFAGELRQCPNCGAPVG